MNFGKRQATALLWRCHFTIPGRGQLQMGNKYAFHNISFAKRHSFIKNLYYFYIFFMLFHFEIFLFYFIFHLNVFLFVRENFIIKTFGIKNSCIYDTAFSSVDFRNVKHLPKKQTPWVAKVFAGAELTGPAWQNSFREFLNKVLQHQDVTSPLGLGRTRFITSLNLMY